jgi:hypothetical protein
MIVIATSYKKKCISSLIDYQLLSYILYNAYSYCQSYLLKGENVGDFKGNQFLIYVKLSQKRTLFVIVSLKKRFYLLKSEFLIVNKLIIFKIITGNIF